MKFSIPCFVSVKDAERRKELIVWLHGIGYSAGWNEFAQHCPIVIARTGIYSEPIIAVANSPERPAIAKYHDCGTDIALFKALAAMNDENDREQWYICYDALTECRYMVGQMYLSTDKRESTNLGIGAYFRKATAAEIIEYFKSKQP